MTPTVETFGVGDWPSTLAYFEQPDERTGDSMNEDRIAKAIHENFTSVNVSDSNFEPANVVDALHQISLAIHDLAVAVRQASGNELA